MIDLDDRVMAELRAWTPPDLPDEREMHTSLGLVRTRLGHHLAAPGHRPGRSRRGLAIALGATALAGGAALVLSLGTGGDDVGVTPASAQALERAADRVEASGGAVPIDPKTGFLYTETSNTWMSCQLDTPAFCQLDRVEREDWIRPGEVGLSRERRWREGFPTEQDRRNWIAAGRPAMGGQLPPSGVSDRPHQQPIRVGNEEVSPDAREIRELTPRRLYERIRDGVTEGQGASRDSETFVQIVDALREGLVPASVQATLYRALTFVPGIEYKGRSHDRLGRVVDLFALAVPERAEQLQVMVDPNTGALLGERTTTYQPPAGLQVRTTAEDGRSVAAAPPQPMAPPGTVIEDSLVVKRAVVAARGERP